MKTFAPIVMLLSALAMPALTGCDLFLGDTKMSKGQLYQSGDTRYDAYFDSVHNEQIKASDWPDDGKQSRKPIVTALSLKSDASNGTILTAIRELKSGSAALGVPVEQTTSSETDRAKRMNAEAQRLEALRDQGEDLRKQAADDKANMGAQKADDKAVAKKDEVKRELSAAVSVLEKMIRDAHRGSREAEELADKLTSSWTGRPEDEKHISLDYTAPAAKKPDAPAPAATTKKAAPSKPPVATKTTGPAPVTPAPTAKPADEVFNP